ncbi:hypothetical protein AYI70_g15 [Smittium culicis]|uniref:Uncharacterized protein n=1 Tax=Smittium culicis TaxID=133412 RepID=A0A1R1YI43_9FUNG|nr:hypothetical protein AYI70_g15 [Smittium culicis]
MFELADRNNRFLSKIHEFVSANSKLKELYNIVYQGLYLDKTGSFSEKSDLTLQIQAHKDIILNRKNVPIDYECGEYCSMNGVGLFDPNFDFALVIDDVRGYCSSELRYDNNFIICSEPSYEYVPLSFELKNCKVYTKPYGSCYLSSVNEDLPCVEKFDS